MSKPKFSIGEEVVCLGKIKREPRSVFGFVWYSKRIPGHYSHEGLVIDISVSQLTGKIIYTVDGSKYSWDEECLRKKHEPSTQSFDEIMRSIKSGVVA